MGEDASEDLAQGRQLHQQVVAASGHAVQEELVALYLTMSWLGDSQYPDWKGGC